jgi:hypothetical protein
VTDITKLITLLGDYATSLDAHLGWVREEFDQLHRAWRALSDVYEGAAADQFRSVFEVTAARMQTYEQDATALLEVLRGGIDNAQQLDRPSTEL